jgi:membrane protein implicated in regulation of membrane protease activity
VDNATIWWILAGVAIGAEMITLTFYLLMVALGLAAAAIAAHLGLGVPLQIVAGAVVGGGAVALWHYKRAKEPVSAPAEENRDVNLDVGASLNIAHWAADRTASVQYRGSVWQAALAAGAAPSALGQYKVVRVEGSRLIVQPV